MRTQIIDQHYLAWLQRRRQDLGEIGLERQPIHTAFHHQCWPHSLMGERGNRGGIERRVAWCACHSSFAERRPSVRRGKVEVAADLVNHDDLGRIQIGLVERKCGALPGIAFGSDQRLFFRDQPIRRIARARVQMLSDVP